MERVGDRGLTIFSWKKNCYVVIVQSSKAEVVSFSVTSEVICNGGPKCAGGLV